MKPSNLLRIGIVLALGLAVVNCGAAEPAPVGPGNQAPPVFGDPGYSNPGTPGSPGTVLPSDKKSVIDGLATPP